MADTERTQTLPSARASSSAQGSTHDDDHGVRPRDFEFDRVMVAARRALFGSRVATLPNIGRYRIERRLGAGGMGEVYLGFDPELERYAAVKLVRAEYSSQLGAERMKLEAKALARLKHTNVVGVYEVGEHDRRTFLAMEYVPGGTLEDALAEADPPLGWAEILGLFVAAGRGLAAAHAAGIVHRDFKPANVMLGDDGRVVVTDFGLALAGIANTADADADERGETKPGSVETWRAPSDRLSMTGTMLGTIRFMPLEQLEARSVDARADQFAFCISLYEALWGCAPFPDTSLQIRRDALREAVAIRRPERGRAPMALWRIIARGLAIEPAQRWPSMLELLAALEAVPRRRRHFKQAALATPALAGVVALGVWALPNAPEPIDACAAELEVIDEVWSTTRHAELEQVFARSGLPFAKASAEQAASLLDTWRDAWVSEREQLCRATVAGSVAPEISGMRGACLERARLELDAVVTVLLEADAETVTRAQELSASLPSLARCRDDASLLLGVAAPSEDQRAEVSELRRRLALIDARVRAGREQGLRAELDTLLAEAEATGYRPLLAEALVSRGDLECSALELDAGVRSYEQAIDLAEATRHDQLLARAWLELAVRGVNDLGDADRSETWLRRASASNERLGLEPRAAMQLEFVAALLDELRGDRAASERKLRALLERPEFDEDPSFALRRPAYLSHLANVVAGDPNAIRQAEALTLYQQALDAALAVLPGDHPEVANHAYNLGQALLNAGRTADAHAQLERAADIWMNVHGEPHPQLALALLSMTELELADDDLEAAQRHAELAEQMFARSSDAAHEQRGNAALAAAVVAHMRGELEQALAGYERAAEHFAAAPGVDVEHDPTLALIEANIGACALDLDHLTRARESFTRALAQTSEGPHAVIANLGLAGLALRHANFVSTAGHLRDLERMADALDDGDRLEFELLRAVLTLRRDGWAPTASPDLRAGLEDPKHPHHRRLTNVERTVSLKNTERSRLLMQAKESRND